FGERKPAGAFEKTLQKPRCARLWSVEGCNGRLAAWQAACPGMRSVRLLPRHLLDAGQQPARVLGLVKVPDLFEAEGLGAGCFAQHARIAHAGKMAAGHRLD